MSDIREMIDQSLRQLAAHQPFQAYMALIEEARNGVAADLCREDVVESDRKTLAAIGELRVYQHLLDQYAAVRQNVAAADQQQQGESADDQLSP